MVAVMWDGDGPWASVVQAPLQPTAVETALDIVWHVAGPASTATVPLLQEGQWSAAELSLRSNPEGPCGNETDLTLRIQGGLVTATSTCCHTTLGQWPVQPSAHAECAGSVLLEAASVGLYGMPWMTLVTKRAYPESR
jgi:hypothetical protein